MHRKHDATAVRESDAWAAGAMGRTRYALLAVCVVAQAATVLITWPLWQARVDPPTLPVVDLPDWSFGYAMLASLALVLVRPRWGLVSHAVVLLVACLFDQLRTQPQFLALLILMAGCVSVPGSRVARWFLAAMWFWAGLHKLLSPDWWTTVTSWMIGPLQLDEATWLRPVALGVAAVEIALGLAACWRPRWAAILCVAVHVGIAVYLTPWLLDWNVSVIPWNLCSAVVGCWLMWTAEAGLPRLRWELAVAAMLFLMPIGFYPGVVDHGVANVLYSDNLPRGLMTLDGNPREIEGWGALRVPFPNERRFLRRYFERVARPGDKLHISESRPWLDDVYFVMTDTGAARPIDAEAFHAADNGPPGVALDNRRSIFALVRAGAKLLRRTPESMIYAAEIPPDKYHPDMLPLLAGLPNLEQLQLVGCDVRDDDLRHLTGLRNLQGIGLSQTPITDEGLAHLRGLPRLIVIEYNGTPITDEGLRGLGLPTNNLPR
jgi:hypothetical protein